MTGPFLFSIRIFEVPNKIQKISKGIKNEIELENDKGDWKMIRRKRKNPLLHAR
jgi:hypothetical protein